MAGQPEEEYEIESPSHIAVQSDRQPVLGYGDIDKPNSEIKGVPPQLEDVVDRAVELLKRVVRREIDATLDDLKEHVNFFQCGAGAGRLVALPENVTQIIRNLCHGVLYHANAHLTAFAHRGERDNEIFDILNQYCTKVKELIAGCLVARLRLEDDLMLGELISNLGFISCQIDEVVFDKIDLKSIVGNRGLERQIRNDVVSLLTRIVENLKIITFVKRKEMLDFLHKRADGIALIIMVCHRAPEPSIHHRLRDSKRRFMDGFQNFQVTYKELYELLELVKEPPAPTRVESSQDGGGAKKEGTEEGGVKKEGSEGGGVKKEGTEGGGAKKEGTEEGAVGGGMTTPTSVLSLAFESLDVSSSQLFGKPLSETVLYISALGSHMTERKLFDDFKGYGTLLNVHINKDSLAKNKGFGFVRFLDKEDARKANLLNPHNSRMANESSQHRLSETKVYIQSEGITKEYLRDLSQNFANVTDILAFPDKSFGFLDFLSQDDAYNALALLQGMDIYALMARPKRPSLGAQASLSP